MHTPHLFNLSRQLARPLIVFDIEHTGSKAEERGITEFACLVIADSRSEEHTSELQSQR